MITDLKGPTMWGPKIRTRVSFLLKNNNMEYKKGGAAIEPNEPNEKGNSFTNLVFVLLI